MSVVDIASLFPSGDMLGRKYESGLASSGCVLPAASSHCTVNSPPPASPLRYTSVPVWEKSSCAEPVQHWRGRAAHLQPVQVERDDKQCAPVHVNQMAAGQVAAERAALQEHFPPMVRQRDDFDVGPTKPSYRLVSGEQYGLASRQNLRPTVRSFSSLQLGHGRGAPPGGSDPR